MISASPSEERLSRWGTDLRGHVRRWGSLLLIGLGVLAAGIVMAIPYGVTAGSRTVLLLAAIGTPALLASHLAVQLRSRMGSLGRQFVVVIGFPLAVALVGLGLISASMTGSPRDRLMVALMLASAAAVTAYSAWLLTWGVRADIMSVHDGIRAVGEGTTPPEICTGADDETTRLAEAATEMVAQLAQRAAERDGAEQMREDLARALVAQLTRQASERDAAEARRRNLVVALSHDVRTPLTALQLLVSAMRDGVVSPNLHAPYFARMLRQLDALRTLTDEIFDFARLEAGDVEWTADRVEIDELIHEAADTLLPQALAADVAMNFAVPPGLGTVSGAPKKLARVLINLIANALAHTPPGGTVQVSATQDDAEITIEVADTGAGVQTVDRDRIFDPFFRGGSNAARPKPGTGLGLSIARAIIEAHAGRIWLADSPGGAVFRLTLPRARNRTPNRLPGFQHLPRR